MITPDEAHERAKNNFLSGLNCTQSVVEVFAEELGVDKDLIVPLVLPFGGGVCRMREMCGTVSGMMFCLGMKMKQNADKNAATAEQIMLTGQLPDYKLKKDETYAEGQKLAQEFRKVNGSIICRELLGLVPMGTSEALMKEGKADSHKADSPVSEERTPDYYKKRPCAELCGVAAEIFAKWLQDFNSKQAQEEK